MSWNRLGMIKGPAHVSVVARYVKNASMKLQVIVGSTRPTRAADKVVPWVVNRAALHEAFETEVIDLRDWQLPMFGEHMGSIGDPNDPSYSDQIVRQWNRKIAEG